MGELVKEQAIVIVAYSIRTKATTNVPCEDAPASVFGRAAGVERHLCAAAS